MPIVKGSKKEPDGSDMDALNDWRTHELDARVQIQLTLQEEQLSGVMSAKDAKETWDRILWRLQGEGRHSIALLIGELFHSTLSDENPLETQLDAMLQIGYNLHSLGQQLDDSLIAIVMIISLPDSYLTLRSILMATDLKLMTQSVKSSILQEEQICKGTNRSRALTAQIQKKNTKNKRGQTKGKQPAGGDKEEKDKTGPKKVYNYAGCKIKGHTDDECRKLKAVLEKYGNSKDKSYELKSTSSNTIAANRTATFSKNYDDNSICLFTTQVQSQSSLVDTLICLHATHHAPLSKLHGWMVDSGATKPMSSQHDLFLSYRKLITPKPIRLGDDSIIYVYGISTVSLSFNLNESKHKGIIKDVYHIPDLQGNLLSISALTKRGHKFVLTLTDAE
jgi:hypothetical protein